MKKIVHLPCRGNKPLHRELIQLAWEWVWWRAKGWKPGAAAGGAALCSRTVKPVSY